MSQEKRSTVRAAQAKADRENVRNQKKEPEVESTSESESDMESGFPQLPDHFSDSGTESDDIDEELEDSQSSDDDSDDDEGSEDETGQISVEFLFNDPRPIDYKSVRRLCERYLPGEEDSFNVSEMADAIIAQQAVGTMIKVTDDDDVYAFATILPYSVHRESSWMQQIVKYIMNKVSALPNNYRIYNRFNRLFSSSNSRLGLLLNERVVNMPPEIAPALHNSLLQDVAWAQNKSSNPDAYKFDYVLVLSPCWVEQTNEATVAQFKSMVEESSLLAAQVAKEPLNRGKDAKKKKAEKEAASASDSEDEGEDDNGNSLKKYQLIYKNKVPGALVHYYHFEEELWEKEAKIFFSFPVETKDADTQTMPNAKPAAGVKRTKDEDGEEIENSIARPKQIRHVMLVPVTALDKSATAMQYLLQLAQEAAGQQSSASGVLTAASGAGSDAVIEAELDKMRKRAKRSNPKGPSKVPKVLSRSKIN